MKKLGIIGFAILIFLFTAPHHSEAKRKNYYRTFEIVALSKSGLTLRDNDGNIIEIDKDPKDYKVGYKVRYDSVRKRLRAYRWQDYKVIAISRNSITLQHKTGDTLTVQGNYAAKYNIGDQVRYDSIDKKVHPEKDSGQWKQYAVVAATGDQITLQRNDGQQVIVYMNNNLYPKHRGVFIGKYNVGDLVRYNAATNDIKMGVVRTYDWQDYEIKKVTEKQIILAAKNKEDIFLKNTYGTKFKTGDLVKYDRINNLLKKRR